MTTFDATTLTAVSTEVAQSLAAIENSEQAIISTRRHLADVLKSVEKCEWKALAKPLKRALSEVEKRKMDATGMPVEPEAWVPRWTEGTVNQILAVLKLCHEYRLTPVRYTSLNVFKGLKEYMDWDGQVVKPDFKVKPQTNPAPKTDTAAPKTDTTATKATESAPDAQKAPSPTNPTGSAGKADIQHSNVSAEEVLSPHEMVFLHLEHARRVENGRIYAALMTSVSQALGLADDAVATTIALKIDDARKAMTPKKK